MSMKRIKQDDMVVVLKGKNRGASGKVIRIDSSKALVEGINLIKKHVKPNPEKNIQGGIVEREALIDVSNLAIMNPTTKKADKIGFKILADGKKVRYFKSNDEMVEI